MGKLKEARKKAGLSQAALAEAAGVSQRAVAKWELKGVERAEFGCMVRLADALGCGVRDLYE